MRWFFRFIMIVTLLGGTGVVIPPAIAAQEATPVDRTRSTLPDQPATGPGGVERTYPAARAVRYGLEPGGYWIWEPITADGNAPEGNPLPVVFYLSGCCATGTRPSPEDVDPWLTYLARQGYVIVAPVYERPTALSDSVMLIKDALSELEAPGHAPIDPTRSAMIGFSWGGPVALLLAAAASAEGIPVPRALFLSSPCGSCLEIPIESLAFAAEMKAIVITYDGDLSGYDDAVLIWDELTTIPEADRDFVMMRSDSHGRPPLWAVHETPNNAVDAADWYGVWKLSDALLACSFSGIWCDHALGSTPEQRSMGVWSDGTPVKELEVTDHPADRSAVRRMVESQTARHMNPAPE